MAWYDKKWVIILFLLFLFPVGLIIMWRSPTFSTKAKGIVTALFVLVIISSDTNKTPSKSTTPPAATNVEDKSQPAQVVAPVQKPAPAKVLNLGMTFEQFKAAYNAKIAEYVPETGWDVSATTLISGTGQDVFMWQFMEQVALMGMVDKSTGMVKNLVVMALPQNQTDYEGAMVVYTLVITVLNPELNYGQRSELLGELHIFDTLYDTFTDLQHHNFDALRGNVKYQTDYIAEKGAFNFWASAKDL